MKKMFLLLLAATIVAATAQTTHAGNKRQAKLERKLQHIKQQQFDAHMASVEAFWKKKAEDSAYCRRELDKINAGAYTNCYREVHSGNVIYYDYGYTDGVATTFGLKENPMPYFVPAPAKTADSVLQNK